MGIWTTWKSVLYWQFDLPSFFFKRVATRLPRLDAANCKTQEPVWTSRSSNRWGWELELRTCSSKCKSITAKTVICISYREYFVLVAHVLWWYCDISLSTCSTRGEFIDSCHCLALVYRSIHLNFSKPQNILSLTCHSLRRWWVSSEPTQQVQRILDNVLQENIPPWESRVSVMCNVLLNNCKFRLLLQCFDFQVQCCRRLCAFCLFVFLHITDGQQSQLFTSLTNDWIVTEPLDKKRWANAAG